MEKGTMNVKLCIMFNQTNANFIIYYPLVTIIERTRVL